MLGAHLPARKRFLWEILQIESQDHFRLTMDRARKHMPVFFVISALADEVFETLRQGLRKNSAQLCLEAVRDALRPL